MEPAGARGRAPWLLPGELALAAALGAVLFVLTGQSVIWVLGGVLGAWTACRAARALGAAHEPSTGIRKSGQLVIGAAIGPGVAAQQLSVSPTQLAIMAGGVVATIGAALLVARLYAASTGLDGLTAGLATLPGGIGVMPSVAADYGRRADLVALVQAFRMVLVLVLALVVFGTSRADVEPGAVDTVLGLLPASGPAWLFVAALLGGAVPASRVAARLRVPVPTLLGPLVYGAALAIGLRALGVAPDVLAIPFAQEVVGQALLGITIGEYLARRTPDRAPSLVGGLVAVTGMCALAVAVAAVVSATGRWSFLVAFLMVAPGGAPEMVVIAAALGGDLALVLTAQTARQVAVNLLMPVWVRLFPRFDHPRRPP